MIDPNEALQVLNDTPPEKIIEHLLKHGGYATVTFFGRDIKIELSILKRGKKNAQ